jgi:hypothetical protein
MPHFYAGGDALCWLHNLGWVLCCIPKKRKQQYVVGPENRGTAFMGLFKQMRRKY